MAHTKTQTTIIMGAIVEKVSGQPQTSFVSFLQSQARRPKPALVAVKFPAQRLEHILALVNSNLIKGVTIVDSTLRYRRARYHAQLHKQPIQNILAIMPTAWEKWDDVAEELYAHLSGRVYLLDNSTEAYDCADKEIVLNEKGEIVAERRGGCLC